MRKKTKNIVPWYEEYFGPDYLLIDIHKNTSKEVDFIYDVLRLKKKTKLLDCACGYGRHLAPLVKRGIDVIGCDLSQFMLDKAQEKLRGTKKNRLVRCDLRYLPFIKVFDCACNMFNSFGYFKSEEDNFKVLTSLAKSLKPEGLFLLDHVNRDFILCSSPKKDWFVKDGAIILEKKWIDPVKNRSEIDVSVIDKKGKRDYHHSIRVYSFTEIRMLLEAAGFIIIDVFGGFGGEEFDLNHDRMLILSQVIDMEDV